MHSWTSAPHTFTRCQILPITPLLFLFLHSCISPVPLLSFPFPGLDEWRLPYSTIEAAHWGMPEMSGVSRRLVATSNTLHTPLASITSPYTFYILLSHTRTCIHSSSLPSLTFTEENLAWCKQKWMSLWESVLMWSCEDDKQKKKKKETLMCLYISTSLGYQIIVFN